MKTRPAWSEQSEGGDDTAAQVLCRNVKASARTAEGEGKSHWEVVVGLGVGEGVEKSSHESILILEEQTM